MMAFLLRSKSPSATDPNISVPDNPRNVSFPSLNSDGSAVLTFGRNLNAPIGTSWIFSRSSDLNSESFQAIFRFDGFNVLDEEVGNTSAITDTAPPNSVIFYRFETESVE